MTSQTSKPYDRLPNETSKAWAAFCIYRDMGGDRSHEKLRQKYGKTTARYFHIWSAKYKWVERCKAFDNEELEKQSIALRETRLKRRIKMEEDAWKRSDKLIKKAETILAIPIAKPVTGEDGTTIYMPTDKWSLKDAIAFFQYADNLRIFATGGETPKMTEIDAVRVLAQANLLPAEILEAAEQGSDALRAKITEGFQNLKKPTPDS